MRKWLIVDDDPEDQDIFEMAVMDVDPGIKLLKTNNGAAAMELLNSLEPVELPDLVFLDLNMGQMDGRECLQEIKRSDTLQHLPVIIYTTSSDPRDVRELTNGGAAQFVTKPTSLAELVEILRTIALQTA